VTNLDITNKSKDKAESNCKELDGREEVGLVAVDEHGGGGQRRLVRGRTHEDAYQRHQCDGGGRQHRRRHYVISQGLHCQYGIFLRILFMTIKSRTKLN
jgi:hypothetical protein